MTRHDKLSFGIASLLLLAALGPGCGGAAMRPGEHVEPERDNPVDLDAEQVERVEELDRALASPEADCASACALGDAICDLEARICGIAQRHPEDEATHARCEDAGGRCEGARSRIAERCACDAPPPG